ncbi:MAG: hypothetical protein MZV49_18075 [Rhodopseudomonas palustris]|nr:hypothetical protein [Rhodopseudomonas palustris]
MPKSFPPVTTLVVKDRVLKDHGHRRLPHQMSVHRSARNASPHAPNCDAPQDPALSGS